MAYINAPFKSALPNVVGKSANAYARDPSADVQFIRDRQVRHGLQRAFGDLPYHVQQHMAQHALQLHQSQQMRLQQRQYFWGVQQQPVAQQLNRYHMPQVLGRHQQQLPMRQFQHIQQPVQQRAQQQQQQISPQQVQQQLQQQFHWHQLQLQQQAPSPQHQFQPQNQRVGQQQAFQQQPNQRQMSVPQPPFAAPIALPTMTQPMFNGGSTPASVRSEAVATKAINQMFWANGVGALITPNFAEMSDGPSNGPKLLDIVTPSPDHMSRAYQLLTGATLPIVLDNGDRATIRAVGASPLVPGQTAKIDLQVIRENGRFRRLYVDLTSEAPTPVQGASVQAVPAPTTPHNRHVQFHPNVQTFAQDDPVGRWEPISG